jgi:peroxiredoxin Q/BCP
VLGASFDTPEENAAFAEKYSFPFPLLCDTDRSLGIAYGAATGPDDAMARRVGVIIGPDGRIVAWHARVDPSTFPEQALAALPTASTPS